MKTHILILGLILILVAGCSPQQVVESTAADIARENVEEAAIGVKEAVKDKLEEESEELVNFRCDIAGQTYYFLKQKAKVQSVAGTSWLNDEGFFTLFEMNNQQFLVQYPADEADISFNDMMVAYKSSEKVEGYNCELNTVEEDDVALPDLPILTPEEMVDMMMGGMESVGLE